MILISGKLASAYRNYCDSKFVFVRGLDELQLLYFEMKMFNLPRTEGNMKKKKKKKQKSEQNTVAGLFMDKTLKM